MYKTSSAIPGQVIGCCGVRFLVVNLPPRPVIPSIAAAIRIVVKVLAVAVHVILPLVCSGALECVGTVQIRFGLARTADRHLFA